MLINELIKEKGLDKVIKEFNLQIDEKDNLVLLNYHQFKSPKFNHFVNMCRGIILEKDSWKIVSYPFYRFYNIGEDNLTYDWNNHILQEKIDGSLIQIFYYKNKWRVATRGKIDAEGYLPNDENKTFADLIFKITTSRFWDSLETDKMYYFELVSPKNRNITPYEYEALYFLMARQDLHELSCCLPPKDTFVPKKFTDNYTQEKARLKIVDEGFVASFNQKEKDGLSYKRVKIKNEQYIELFYLKQNIERNMLKIILRGEFAEVISYLPEYKNALLKLQKEFSGLKEKIRCVYEAYKNLPIKEFALAVKDLPFSDCLFRMYKYKITVEEYLEQLDENRAIMFLKKNLY